MPATFPGAVVQLGTKTDLQDIVYAADYNGLAQEVVAIEKTLGVNPQGGSADVAGRLGTVESATDDYTANGVKSTGDQGITGQKSFQNLVVGGLAPQQVAPVTFYYAPSRAVVINGQVQPTPQAQIRFNGSRLTASTGYGTSVVDLVSGPLRSAHPTSPDDRFLKGQFSFTWPGGTGIASGTVTLPQTVPVVTAGSDSPASDGAQTFMQVRLISGAGVPHTVVATMAGWAKSNDGKSFVSFNFVVNCLTGNPAQGAVSQVDYLAVFPGLVNANG